MLFRSCKECGKEISNKAKKCSYCGAPIKNKILSIIKVIMFTIIIFIFIIAIIIMIGIGVSIIQYDENNISNGSITDNESIEQKQNDFISEEVLQTAYQYLIEEIELKLKNPNSLQIHGSSVSTYIYIKQNGKADFAYSLDELKQKYDEIHFTDYSIHINVDMSAQNGFGGYNRNTVKGVVFVKNENNKITITPSVVDMEK